MVSASSTFIASNSRINRRMTSDLSPGRVSAIAPPSCHGALHARASVRQNGADVHIDTQLLHLAILEADGIAAGQGELLPVMSMVGDGHLADQRGVVHLPQIADVVHTVLHFRQEALGSVDDPLRSVDDGEIAEL